MSKKPPQLHLNNEQLDRHIIKIVTASSGAQQIEVHHFHTPESENK